MFYCSASEMGFRGTLGFRDASQGFREAFRNLKVYVKIIYILCKNEIRGSAEKLNFGKGFRH